MDDASPLASVPLVPERAALSVTGPDARTYRAPHATYAVGAQAIVVLLEPGDRPGGTAVQDERTVLLTPPFPAEVHELVPHDPDEDPRSWGRPAGQMPVHVYVRLPGGCLALGDVRATGGEWQPGERRLVSWPLYLSTPLPPDTLDLIRPAPPAPPPSSTAWLRHLPRDPVTATRAFLDTWYADLPSETPCRPRYPMPPPLAAFHAAIAGREELLGRQNFLFAPDRLRLDEAGRLEFGTENQGGFTLVTEPGDDPPVWYTDWDDEPIRDPNPLSVFLLWFALFEATVTNPYHVITPVAAADIPAVTAGMQRVPLPASWWPDLRAEAYVGCGRVVVLYPGDPQAADGSHWLWAGARHRAHLRPVWRVTKGRRR
ncbi:hypothetical protein [Dactylosporangium sp. NPDC000521]|uniref:hypothetical protein n=1 Tax=Dactylosporangium sp. NPDC000521 TaxID=3363975 RepID=UPI0036A9EC52